MSAGPPDIFISYAREDVEWVRPLAAELERRGWSVFWDQRIPAGKSWRSHIGVRLEAARCVIVVWSESALKSNFVLQEADIGLEREVLLPVLREPVRPPLGFREIHAANLAEWRPGQRSVELETFIADLGELLASSPAAGGLPFEPEPEAPVSASPPAFPPRPADRTQRLAGITEEKPRSGAQARPAGKPPSAIKHGRSGSALVFALLALATIGGGLYAMYGPGSLAFQQAVTSPAPAVPSQPAPTPQTASAPPSKQASPTGTLAAPAEPSQSAATTLSASAAPSEPAPPTDTPAAPPPSAGVAVAEPSVVVSSEAARTADSSTPAYMETKLGLSPDDWHALQNAIAALGFDTGGADGRPGATTRKALAGWQASKHIEATGFLAPLQRELILAEAAPKLAAPNATASGQSAAKTSSTALGSAKLGASSRAPSTVFRDCADCPELVVIPAGSFTMGSTPEERKWAVDQGGKAEWYAAEQPAHQVTIAADFAIGRAEVTRGQFASFVAATNREMSGGCQSYSGSEWKLDEDKSWRNPGFAQTDDHPVVCVSWQDAVAYVDWLWQRTGKGYRLPSEGEWEYAARASTKTIRYWGDDFKNQYLCANANAADLNAKDKLPGWSTLQCRDGIVYTAPVGRYAANKFKLNDVLGNVWEWTEDCYHDSYQGASSDGSAWVVYGCPERVLRGGSWSSIPWVLRSAIRVSYAPVGRLDNLGFRVARMLTP